MSDGEKKRGELVDNHKMVVGVTGNRTNSIRVQFKSMANGNLGDPAYLRELPQIDKNSFVDVPGRGLCPVMKIAQFVVPEEDGGLPEAFVYVGDALGRKG